MTKLAKNSLWRQITILPGKPGVYLFKDRAGKIIYVGKALNLKKRVASHFLKKFFLLGREELLVSQTKTVNFFLVESEIEALLLEADLIKKYQPKYNVRLKDDKSYLYIKITQSDDFPKVLTARREKIPGHLYFGPFPSAKTVRATLRSLRRFFPYCNCHFKICQRRRSCLWVELGLDSGPCLGKIDKASYRKIIRHLTYLLFGKKEKLLKLLQKEMRAAAQKEEFEKAQFYKRQIAGIEYLTRPLRAPSEYLRSPEIFNKKRQEALKELQKLLGLSRIPFRIEGYDISNIGGQEATGSMVVFTRGEADKSGYRRFKIKISQRPDDVAMLKEVMRRRLAHPEWPLPDLVVVDGGKGQVGGVLRVLEEAKITLPMIGLAKRLEEIIIPAKLRSRGAKKLKFKTIRRPPDSSVLQLLQRLRDESHRFALTYHRKLRIKTLIS